MVPVAVKERAAESERDGDVSSSGKIEAFPNRPNNASPWPPAIAPRIGVFVSILISALPEAFNTPTNSASAHVMLISAEPDPETFNSPVPSANTSNNALPDRSGEVDPARGGNQLPMREQERVAVLMERPRYGALFKLFCSTCLEATHSLFLSLALIG